MKTPFSCLHKGVPFHLSLLCPTNLASNSLAGQQFGACGWSFRISWTKHARPLSYRLGKMGHLVLDAVCHGASSASSASIEGREGAGGMD